MGADDCGTLRASAREERVLGALAPSVAVEDDCGTLRASDCCFPPLLEALLVGADDCGTLRVSAREERILAALAPLVVVEDECGTLLVLAREALVLGALALRVVRTAAPPPSFVRWGPLE